MVFSDGKGLTCFSFTGATRSTHQATILGHVSDITASSGLHLNTAKIFFFSNKNIILQTRCMHLRSKKRKIKLVKKFMFLTPLANCLANFLCKFFTKHSIQGDTLYMNGFTVDLWRILWLNLNSSV